MCACGRSRPEVITTVQAEQQLADQQAYSQLLQQTVQEAELYLRSAAQAARNASSE
jgi:hypothetical protein